MPGWHLVGVPGFVVAAVWLGARRLREEARVVSLSGPCPACAREQVFPPPAGARLPATLRCPGCGEFVKVGTSL